MPPKKGGGSKGGGSSNKVVVDKTFGMKNKKGAKAQKQVKIIEQQQKTAGKTKEQLAKEKMKEAEKAAKAEAEKIRKEMAASMTIVQPKVPFGVDPKTITCEFWRAGRCDKGNKCKFAHSEDANRKVQKKDLYVDTRDKEKEEREKDTMDTWDKEKLEKVILSKHGNPRTTTDKVCKYFLQAVEDGKYGWFWECQNGQNCMYRHALPPGFVLKSVRKEQEALEKANEISLEDFLEVERHKLGKDLTPVTAETFAQWKKDRMDKKEAEEQLARSKKEAQAKMNKMTGLSGREMFTLNPDMFEEDDDGEDDGEYDLRDYLKDWNQERQSDDDEAGGISEDEDYQEDDEEANGRAGPSETNDESAESKSASQGTGDAAVSEKMSKLTVNGDEGEEEGKRK